jgi:2,3-dihydroxybenzoate-AMP ligase
MVLAEKLVRYPAEVVAGYRQRGLWGDLTIGDELRAVARRYASLEAVVTPERRLSYADLDGESEAVATRLHRLGLRAGDAVILQVGNTAESLVAFYGLIKLGAVPVCSLIPFGHHEIDAIAGIVDARAHLVQADIPEPDLVAFAREVKDVVPSMELILTIRGGADGAHRIDDAEPARASAVYPEPGADDVAVFQLSGGTTGTPKVIPRFHAEYWYYGRVSAARFGYAPGDRVGHFLPLVHNAGIHAAVFAAHSVGATLVLGPTWRPDLVLGLLASEKLTHLNTLTSLIPSVCDDPAFPEAAANLKRLSLAVPAVPPELFDRITGLGLQVCQFYGMSEGFACSMPTDAPVQMRRETVGYPLSPEDEFTIRDPETGADVVHGATGELCVRGPYTLRGYYGAEEHNARAFTDDGFYRTGDLVSSIEIEGHPCFRIEGRHKDLISRGGEKINAHEIEDLLVQLPNVREAALVAMPDSRLGERPCAFVVTAPADPPLLSDVRAFLAERGVAKFKWPERIEAIDALPLTPVGKVAKAKLREEIRHRLQLESTPSFGN